MKLKWKLNSHFSLFYFRYSPKSLPIYPKCQHKTTSLQCSSLTMVDIKNFHKLYYSSNDKLKQDNFILNYCNVKKVDRHRPSTGSRPSKTLSISYKIRTSSRNVPVCRETFLGVLGISKNRVQTVTKHYLLTGDVPKENRGGDRVKNKNDGKKNAVVAYISGYKSVESHYCRSKTTMRVYLPCELSIKAMWRAYNSDCVQQLNVNYSYFRMLFNTKFNIGFGSPLTDVCSTCLELGEKIKKEGNAGKKQVLITQKRIHKLRAKAFFSLLREEREGLLTLSYDCQKNMPLPKIPDQATYYSRQLYTYNFTVVQGSSKSKLSKNNVFTYCWTENMYSKGSNEIGSALYHRLCNTNFSGIDTIRLVADGCGGQNKNYIIVGMCSKWLARDSPKNVNKIELVFPVVGHSFMPPDRVFGLIEKKVKARNRIVKPEEYRDIFSEHGTVILLGIDCNVYDWKAAAQNVLKTTSLWHFQFKPSKRFFLFKSLKNVKVQGELNYRCEVGTPKGVCKKGKHVSQIDP